MLPILIKGCSHGAELPPQVPNILEKIARNKRIDTTPEGARRMYIMTLGCLAPYRRLGIGTVMLKHVLKYCEKDGNIDNLYLHVQINNESAIEFYKHFGFEIIETKQHYYKRIEPAEAHVFTKNSQTIRMSGDTS
ncbi:putative N-alpha-acetyltransferase 50 [Apostichopus japonicus]|uniref:N-terminal methionine N(alpha)-acetyltransferase NatE n=1 Tax=Stichopus japonicus TaxID=307972 RepID=A0A2G8LJA8_STIJA|nr:putative N-alpha-acetyltransferase 50 [Apostichopus japonicus]